MRRSKLVIFAAIALAACGSDRRPMSPSEPAFDKGGAATPNATVNLMASYSTLVPTFYNDGRTVSGAPEVNYTLSVGGDAPADINHLTTCLGSWTTNRGTDFMTVCLFRATGYVALAATCGAMKYVDLPLSVPGVLTAYAAMWPSASYVTWIWVGPGHQIISTSVSNDVILGEVPEPIFSTIRDAVLASIAWPFRPMGAFHRIGYLPHDKTTSDIAHNDYFDGVVSDLSPALANHPACRGPDQETPVVIPFTETANFVTTPSGNLNLIFNSSVDETALHYNANEGITRGTGALLSDDGLSFIDLSQFTGSTLPIIDQIMTGAGAHARACKTATPAECTDVTLKRQQ